MLRKIGIGCGGLLAVLVLLVIVDALIGSKPAQDAAQKGFDEGFKAVSGDSSSSSSQSSETTQSKAQNKGGRAPLRFGTGTPGVPFSGNYGSTSAGNTSVDGAIPEDLEISYKSGFGQFDVVTAFFQKQTDDASELTVQIVVDGQVKKEQTSTAAYGVADVSWSTNE